MANPYDKVRTRIPFRQVVTHTNARVDAVELVDAKKPDRRGQLMEYQYSPRLDNFAAKTASASVDRPRAVGICFRDK